MNLGQADSAYHDRRRLQGARGRKGTLRSRRNPDGETPEHQTVRRCLTIDPLNLSASGNAGAKAGGLASFEQASQGKLDELLASNPDPPTRVHTRSETTTTSHEKSRWRKLGADRPQEGPR